MSDSGAKTNAHLGEMRTITVMADQCGHKVLSVLQSTVKRDLTRMIKDASVPRNYRGRVSCSMRKAMKKDCISESLASND